MALVAVVAEQLVLRPGLQHRSAARVIGRIQLAGGVGVDDRVLAGVRAHQAPLRRIGDVEAVGVDRHAVAVVEGEGLVGGLQEHLVELRLLEVGLGKAHRPPEIQGVRRLVGAVEHRLGEGGLVVGALVLCAQVHAGEGAIHQGVADDGRGVEALGPGDVAGQGVVAGRRQGELAAVVAQRSIEQVQVQLEACARVVLECRGDPQPLAVVEPGGIGLGLGRDHAGVSGRVHQPRGVRRRDARPDVSGADVDPAPAPVAVPVLVDVVGAVGHGHQGPKVAPAVGNQPHQPRRRAARVGVGQRLGRQGQLRARVVEGVGGVQAHGPGDPALVLVGGVGLLHRDPVEQLRGEDAVVEGARAAHRAAVVEARRGRGRNLHAVELGAGEVGPQAPQDDLTTLAGVAGNGQAGDALQGFGQVQIREGGDVVGEDDILLSDGPALEIPGVGEAVPEPGDNDAFHLRRARLRRRRGGGARRPARAPGRVLQHIAADDRFGGQALAVDQQRQGPVRRHGSGHLSRGAAPHVGEGHDRRSRLFREGLERLDQVAAPDVESLGGGCRLGDSRSQADPEQQGGLQGPGARNRFSTGHA